MQILYLQEVWHSGSDGRGAVITDFGGARISAELALQKRRIQLESNNIRIIPKFYVIAWNKVIISHERKSFAQSIRGRLLEYAYRLELKGPDLRTYNPEDK